VKLKPEKKTILVDKIYDITAIQNQNLHVVELKVFHHVVLVCAIL